jgi:small subunit ribosomal protein S6
MSSQYEITYIVRPLLEDPQVDEVAAHFSEVAKQNGGENIGAERMGKKRLAYEIQKLREGHYICMKFKGGAETANEVIRQMRLHENVLRALVVRV